MNLFKDVANTLRAQLREQGYDVSHVQDDDHAALMLHSKVQRYTIEQRPRDIRKSSDFQCPTPYSRGLQRFEKVIQAGENLNPFRSTKIGSATLLDNLLDYWRIYHFHLGINLREDGFVERTGGLLFCLFDDEYAYFIKIGTHDPLQWTERELVEIVHRDWPELLEPFRVNGIANLEHSVSDDERKRLWKANGSAFLEMADGTIYIEPGIGRTTGGLHIDDLSWADSVRRFADNIESQIENNWPRIVDDAASQGYRILGTDHLVLTNTVFNQFWDIQDLESGYRFRQYLVP